MLAIAGCGYFRPANAPQPTQSLPPGNYSRPDATLQTMNIGLSAKSSAGGSLYLSAFAESTTTSTPAYHQLFDPVDVVDWSGGVPGDWERTREQRLYNYLVQLRPDDAYFLNWEDGLVTDDPPDEVNGIAVVHRHYEIITTNEQTSASTVIAIGYAKLTFLRDDQDRWLIVRWEDSRDSEADPNEQEQVSLGRRRLLSQSG